MDEYIPIHFLGERLIFHTLSCAYLLICRSTACYENMKWKRDSFDSLIFITSDGLDKIITIFNLQYNPELLKDMFIDKLKEEYEQQKQDNRKVDTKLHTIISSI